MTSLALRLLVRRGHPARAGRDHAGAALASPSEDDRPLTRYWPTNGPILNNGGDSVQLRRYDDIVLACTAWGTETC